MTVRLTRVCPSFKVDFVISVRVWSNTAITLFSSSGVEGTVKSKNVSVDLIEMATKGKVDEALGDTLGLKDGLLLGADDGLSDGIELG